MGPLKGSQVDSVFFCSGATHVLNHPSAVTDSYADVAERDGLGGEWETFRVNMRALEALGTDGVQLTIDYCRQHGLEVLRHLAAAIGLDGGGDGGEGLGL